MQEFTQGEYPQVHDTNPRRTNSVINKVTELLEKRERVLQAKRVLLPDDMQKRLPATLRQDLEFLGLDENLTLGDILIAANSKGESFVPNIIEGQGRKAVAKHLVESALKDENSCKKIPQPTR